MERSSNAMPTYHPMHQHAVEHAHHLLSSSITTTPASLADKQRRAPDTTHRGGTTTTTTISNSDNLRHYPYSSSVYDTNPGTASARPVTQKPSLASIHIPSFSAFRSQVPSASRYAAFQQQQQPSPRAASFSLAEQPSPRLIDPQCRPLSLDSPLPTPLPGPGRREAPPPPASATEESEQSRQEVADRSSYSLPHHGAHDRHGSIDSRITSTRPTSSAYSSPRHSHISAAAKHAHEPAFAHAPPQSPSSSFDSTEQNFSHSRVGSESSMLHVHKAPTMTLQLDGVQRRLTDEDLEAESQGSDPKRPKSPGSGGMGRFFGWTGSQRSEGVTSPTTTFSDRSLSPLPSPGLVKTLPVDMDGTRLPARLTPPGLDVQKANAGHTYFDNPDTPLLIGASDVHVRELERELSHISQELAGSIRREMELEDELDRIRAEIPMIPASELGRRSSDYFSDSGAGSTKFPITDVDAKLEQMDKQIRRVEQDKANLKNEMATKLQTELSRRRDLEQLVQDLEDQLEKRGGATERVEELETYLDETKRRLGQEKSTKENFEDLYRASKQELEKYRNDADNLRNEVVPQLKARVDGLEAEASDTQAIIYENTRLQQQLAQIRENITHSGFNSISENDTVANAGRMSLQRSGSLARSGSLRRGGSVSMKEGGRQRSGSNGMATPEFKDIEDQRDALHKALKLLIRRYERQQKDHERAIRKLTSEKKKAETITPKRTIYAKEVSFLKEEVSTLRKRTEDALEQKWQYEKSLSGLKMDLDRAEQETRGLRIMLQGKDELSAPSQSSQYGDEDDEQLKLSISRAESERDHARQAAADYRRRAQASSGTSSTDLLKSADRMDELAEKLETQVQTNSQLRERLASAVAKGEREQRESTRQIEDMQKRLAGMEDSVLAAQQHSETTLANHDAEVKRIEDASSPQLQRLRISIPEPSKLAPSSPMLKKSPKLVSKKLSDTSLLEMSRTQLLERKVRELEGLLREAEEDVQTVVERVNRSQMEVAELQTERDAALTQMRKLQTQIVEERERAEGLLR